MLEIDGSFSEGGGQIIRTALSLSAITREGIKITNIRANRPNPGLRAQHLASARAVRSICRGVLSNCEIGSKELVFEPGEIIGGKYKFNIGTAGSVILLAQTILPILLFASKPSTIRISGGTHVMKSPSYDYFEQVFLPALSFFNIRANSRLIRCGFYPEGGGEIELNVEPCKLIKGNTQWTKQEKINVIIRLSDLPLLIALREKKIFLQNEIDNVNILQHKDKPGNAILAWCGLKGAYGLGEKGKRAETVAQECLTEILKEKNSECDIDKHLADQLLLYSALGKEKTIFKTSEITNHTKTNIHVISKFIKRKITINKNKTNEIKVE